MTSATDRVNNTTTATPDYRVLAPATVTDPNGNRAALAFDVLGFPTASAIMGKITQALGDQLTGFTTDLDTATLALQFADPLTDPAGLLGDATTRTIYDLGAYQRTASAAQPAPPAVYTLARETHVSDLAAAPYPGAPQTTRYQYHFSYSDGMGRQIQAKALVAPGPLIDGGDTVTTRWVGSGWTILDNKGRPVRKYEPFFSTTNAFEFAAQTGVSTVLFYDPPGRVVATLQPDNTWAKTVFDPWLTQTWDGDDTVRIPDPTTDSDVGDYFTRYLAATATTFTTWYAQRIGGTYGTTAQDNQWQQDAANKAATAAGTPTATHADSLGRACLAVADNGGGNRYPSRTAYDTEGTPLAVFDALGRRAEEHCYRNPQTGGGFEYLAGNDVAGNPLYHISADAGARRGLNNVAGHPIRSWDAREHVFRTGYDAAQRPTQRYVGTNGAPEILLDYAVYGEGQPAANLCGRIFRHYDTAGYLENTTYDYKGNLLSSVRQLAVDYQQSPDWTPLVGLTAAGQLDTVATTAGLIPTGDGGRDAFTTATSYDALNRPTQQIAAHNPAMKPGVVQPGYDQGAMLTTLDAWLEQAAAPATLLDPATADQHTLTGIEYNARGQRLQTTQGNGTTTVYTYDPLTFRLTGLTTTRPSSFATNQQTVQDLFYYYDPVGNITHIQDNADTQNVVFFNNQRVEPSASYSYDPLYRLTSATGREHLGQTGNGLAAPVQVTNDDSFRLNLPQPGDGNAMGIYTETYNYDSVGNILSMAHTVGSGGWTRHYTYSEQSRIVATEVGNWLSTTSLPNDPAGGPYSATYSHDAHGNMTYMPHLPTMLWDEEDRLRSTARTVASEITPQTTYYSYDSGAQRIRKTTNAQTPAGQTPTRSAERIYLGSLEIYREFDADGTTVTLERETLHLTDSAATIAIVETRTTGTDEYLAQLVRYQYGNHLGSAVLELDDQSSILTYEEYFPYGSTAYQSVASQSDLPKRYRYTGKERDGETDLNYRGSRYYASWLGRWTACDPSGPVDGINLYAYVGDNPITRVDPTGHNGESPAALTSATPNEGDKLRTVVNDRILADVRGGPTQPKKPYEPLPLPKDSWSQVVAAGAAQQFNLAAPGILSNAQNQPPWQTGGTASPDLPGAILKLEPVQTLSTYVGDTFSGETKHDTGMVLLAAAVGVVMLAPVVALALADDARNNTKMAALPISAAPPPGVPPAAAPTDPPLSNPSSWLAPAVSGIASAALGLLFKGSADRHPANQDSADQRPGSLDDPNFMGPKIGQRPAATPYDPDAPLLKNAPLWLQAVPSSKEPTPTTTLPQLFKLDMTIFSNRLSPPSPLSPATSSPTLPAFNSRGQGGMGNLTITPSGGW